MSVRSVIFNEIPFLLLATTGCLLFSTVLVSSGNMVNGTVSGKLEVIHPAVLSFSICVLLALAAKRGQVTATFHFADLFVYLIAIIFFVSYNREADLSPERLALLGQMLVLWFSLRLSLSIFSRLSRFFTIILILTAGLEGIWGIMQIYGLSTSNHSLFRVTGSFHNPGPFSGYLAVILPLALEALLNVKKERFSGIWKQGLTCVLFIVCCLILTILPSGMSRSAWLASTGGCLWVICCDLSATKWLKTALLQYRKWRLAAVILFLTVGGAVFYTLYHMKKESADGRLFIWKMTWHAIQAQPVSGVGLGGFPGAYASAQIDYFSSRNYPEAEQYVAGNPEYAFHEPMQLWLETGLPGLILFTALFMYCFYAGVRNRYYGSCGALLSFGIFSLSSYPLQLPSMLVMLVFLLADCLRGPFMPSWTIIAYPPRMLTVMCLLMVSFSCWQWKREQSRFKAYREWSGLKVLYQAEVWEYATGRYRSLKPELEHLPEFLFEYAQCLRKSGYLEESDGLLKRASLLSSDPMIRNVRGRNQQAMGNFKEAESLYFEAMILQPARVYPYYLLAKLYAEKDFRHPENMKTMAQRALTMKPKVDSRAVEEMRDELRELLKTEN